MNVVDTSLPTRPPSAGPDAAPRTRFRADVQGLRALAVLLVVAYHANVPGIRAGYVGVDVFFVISGFLITTHLVGEARRTGRVRFARFYARRIRRLLPLALLVVVATLAVARWALPPLRVSELVSQALWTTVYGINYRLAAEGVDYQQAASPPSPLQHYWSLAVEEQFYLLWPLLIVAALWAGRRWGARVLPAVLVGVVALSLTASVVLTPADPSLSYFALHTRAWELGAGALVALGARRLARLDRPAAAAMAWTGLTAIVVSAIAYTDETAFPGVAALLPVTGAALVIGSGCGGPLASITRLVGGRPVQTIGTLSYGWYLWHWPVLLLYPAVLGVRGDRPLDLAASALALGLALATHRFVEVPTQSGSWPSGRWLALGGGMSAGAVAFAGLVFVSLPPLTGDGPSVTAPPTAGAVSSDALATVQKTIAASAGLAAAPRNLTPDVWRAVDDFPPTKRTDDHCLAAYLDVDQGPCVFGDPDGERTVVLFGDSHMDQWQPAFDAAGKADGWRVVSWTKSACPLADRAVRSAELGREYTECEEWREQTLERIADLGPDLVVMGQSDLTAKNASTSDEYADETLATVDRLRESGLTVTYVQDTRYPDGDVPTCLSAHLDDVSACTGTDDDAADTAPRREAVARALSAAQVPLVDPTPWQCAGGACPAVVGNLVVYRDHSHLTATYSRWLAPMARSVLADHAS